MSNNNYVYILCDPRVDGFSCFLYDNFINLHKWDVTINDKILKWFGGKEYGKFYRGI
jgi:hypothetical protein